MYFPLMPRLAKSLVGAAVLALTMSVASQHALAETAYIQQSQAGARMPVQSVSMGSVMSGAMQAGRSIAAPTPRVAPEAITQGGRNIAQTLQIGNYNNVAQIQNGANNHSAVGIIAGNANNVGVLQNGNNLKSNLVLLNTQGLSVGVIQPNGSAPINMFIARLPNGGLLIKR